MHVHQILFILCKQKVQEYTIVKLAIYKTPIQRCSSSNESHPYKGSKVIEPMGSNRSNMVVYNSIGCKFSKIVTLINSTQ